MLWLAGNAGLFSAAHEKGISFHSDDVDDRRHDFERDGDSGARDTLRNIDRIPAAACRRHPCGNIAGRGAVAWHGLASNPRGGPDFRSKERQARGRASWLKRIAPGNRPRMRTGWSNCGVFPRRRKRAGERNAASANTRLENFPRVNGLNCFSTKARLRNSINLCVIAAWILV